MQLPCKEPSTCSPEHSTLEVQAGHQLASIQGLTCQRFKHPSAVSSKLNTLSTGHRHTVCSSLILPSHTCTPCALFSKSSTCRQMQCGCVSSLPRDLACALWPAEARDGRNMPGQQRTRLRRVCVLKLKVRLHNVSLPQTIACHRSLC